jgi:hypothetical protein
MVETTPEVSQRDEPQRTVDVGVGELHLMVYWIIRPRAENNKFVLRPTARDN